jgi:hypothetical protein
MGNPWVGFCNTTPVPAHTVPVKGMGAHRTAASAVLHKTHGTIGTRGCMASPNGTNCARIREW